MPTLLIVDDEQEQQDDILRAARSAGFGEAEITRAMSEEEAYRRIAELPLIQVAVVDVMLSTPHLREEGLRVIERLHEKHPLCRILAITKKVGTEAGIKCLEAGAHDFISSKWDFLPFGALLRERLQLWKGIVERVPLVERVPPMPATVS